MIRDALSGTQLFHEQPGQYLPIDPGQLLQLVETDALIDLVDRGVDRAELHDLRADIDEKAPVGGAASGRDRGSNAGYGLDRARHDVHQIALPRKEWLSVVGPVEVVFQ